MVKNCHHIILVQQLAILSWLTFTAYNNGYINSMESALVQIHMVSGSQAPFTTTNQKWDYVDHI